MAEMTIRELRRQAIAATLFPPTTLKRAIERLGFVQCDPIRAPARAQDLILRQRVEGYRAGDLERNYPELGLEEDYLYAYGVVPEATWRLLHPRAKKRLSKSEARVWELVCAQAKMHPRELEPHLGRRRQVNAWGGYSKETTRTLEELHYRGMLRVAGREKGIRLYQAARQQEEYLAPRERLRRLVLLIAGILAPAPERSLRAALRHLAHSAPSLQGRTNVLKGLIDGGDLKAADVAGVRYVWPEGGIREITPAAAAVRFLAPFDPLVWDRRRFEHLWGWAYRFEAYTPPAKRKMGYYAMPLLWGDDVIGWVNVSKSGKRVEMAPGFAGDKPNSRAFRSAFAEEAERMKAFLTQEDEG
jgi:uncharacterized protein YcaQ